MQKKKYTDYEKKTLRVLKMQEGDLKRLDEKTSTQQEALNRMDKRLAAMKERTKSLASDEGVELPEEHHYPVAAPQKGTLGQDAIPSWESLEARAESEDVQHDIVIEDLLTGKEINYAISEVKRINDEFAKRTGLTSRDLSFLTIATGIQTARWMMMPKIIGKLGKSAKVLTALSPSTMAMLESKPTTDEKQLSLIDEANREFQEEILDCEAEEIREGHKTWEEILATKDQVSEKAFNNDAMNWIFGIVNNITGTKTASNFSTKDAVSGENVKTQKMFSDAFSSIKEDPMRLPAAVFAQYSQEKAAHGESVDVLAPVAKAFSPELLSDLYKGQYAQLSSMRELTIVGQQAAFPLIVNMAIGLLHGFMYNAELDGPREFYDARTRKILLLSNMMASGTNLAFSAATEKWMKLDLGGLLVTASRTLQDVAYLTNLEDHFLKQQMDKTLEQELHDIDSHFKNELVKKP